MSESGVPVGENTGANRTPRSRHTAVNHDLFETHLGDALFRSVFWHLSLPFSPEPSARTQTGTILVPSKAGHGPLQ